MTSTKAVDKTVFFKNLEKELDNRTLAPRLQPDEAEADLRPFFENSQGLLTALDIGLLTYEHAFLMSSTARTDVRNIVTTLLTEYRKARDLDEEEFLRFWASQTPSISRAIDNTAAVATLQGGRSDLDLTFQVKSRFRDLGDLLEGSLQPLMRLRLEVWNRMGLRGSKSTPVANLTFGKVTEELMGAVAHAGSYRPPPFMLSVSQWRNIANHNSYEMTDSNIKCTYGTAGHEKSLTLSFDDLVGVLSECNAISYAHKIAYEFFSVDNLTAIASHSPKIAPSEYSKDTSLASGLMSSGFSVISAMYSRDKWHLTLTDRQNRGFAEIKAALQSATYPYLLLSAKCEFAAEVRSSGKKFSVSFIGEIARGSVIPDEFRGDIWTVGDHFKLGSRRSKR